PKGTDIAETVLGALAAKKVAKDTKSATNASVDAAVSHGTTDATAGSSTAATITDVHGDKTVKSDSSTSDSAQDTAPPADPSVNQDLPVAPQLVAIGAGAPVIAAAPTTGSDSGIGQGADQIAALGDAVKAGALLGKADRA